MIAYDKIVIGSSLRAVLFAFSNNYPLFFTEESRPFRFDYFEEHADLSCVKISPRPQSLTTFEGEKKVGVAKEVLWERLLFLLALDGKVPLSNLCESIRYDGERVVCSNEYSKIMEFKFNECYYFGDPNAVGWPSKKSLSNAEYVCYDYIAFNRGGKHSIDYIETGDNLAAEIWFYPSDRIDGSTSVKDACVVSHLTADELKGFDCSETMARFKMISEMESRGMKGLFNGYGPNGKPKHYKFRTTHVSRRTKKITTLSCDANTDLQAPLPTEEDLLKNLPMAASIHSDFLRYL